MTLCFQEFLYTHILYIIFMLFISYFYNMKVYYIHLQLKLLKYWKAICKIFNKLTQILVLQNSWLCKELLKEIILWYVWSAQNCLCDFLNIQICIKNIF